ncbi:MAG: hypothetical protein WCO64_08815, partial [Actinomycetes bacterium]
ILSHSTSSVLSLLRRGATVRSISLAMAMTCVNISLVGAPAHAGTHKIMVCFKTATNLGIGGLHVSWDPDGDVDGFDDVATKSSGCLKKAQIVPDDSALIYADASYAKPIGVGGQTLTSVQIQWAGGDFSAYPLASGARKITFTLEPPPEYSVENIRAVMADGTVIPNAAINLFGADNAPLISQDETKPGKNDVRFVDTDGLFQIEQSGTDPTITQFWTNLDGTKCTGFDVQEDLDNGGVIPSATVCKASSTLTGADGSYALRYYGDSLLPLGPKASFSLALLGLPLVTSLLSSYPLDGDGSTDVEFANLPRITQIPSVPLAANSKVPYTVSVVAMSGANVESASGSPIVGKVLTLKASVTMKSTKSCKPKTKVTTNGLGVATFTLCLTKATTFQITGPQVVPSSGFRATVN